MYANIVFHIEYVTRHEVRLEGVYLSLAVIFLSLACPRDSKRITIGLERPTGFCQVFCFLWFDIIDLLISLEAKNGLPTIFYFLLSCLYLRIILIILIVTETLALQANEIFYF